MLPLIHYLLQVSFITNSPKYANVRCSHRALRRLSAVAKHMAKNEAAKYFAGRFIGLVFSKAELADAGLVRYLKKFDEDNNGALDFSEYAEAVLTDADKYDEYYEDKVDEFAYQMQETGDLNMGSDELDSWYEDPGN